MSILYEDKALTSLQTLGLWVAHARLDSVAQQAAANNWSYSHFLGYLLDDEVQDRQQKRVKLHIQFAGFPVLKRLDHFDFSAQPSLDRRLVEELAGGRYIEEGRNLVLLGPPGVGKTHLAIALGVLGAEQGHRVYFTTAMALAHKLTKAVESHRLHRELHTLTQPKLLIIDEMGYLTFDPVQASLLFQVIAHRYQKGHSLAITSNKALSDWGHIFGDDAVLAAAMLDRLLHRSTVINIKGESYRLKEKRQAGHPLPPPQPVGGDK